MRDTIDPVDRRTVLKAMGAVTTTAGIATGTGTAAKRESFAYGVGGYGEGPYPGNE